MLVVIGFAFGYEITREVDSYEQASKAVREYIESQGFGNSEWAVSPTCGNIYDNGKCIARVSYNGRIWPPGDYDPNAVALYDPFAPKKGDFA